MLPYVGVGCRATTVLTRPITDYAHGPRLAETISESSIGQAAARCPDESRREPHATRDVHAVAERP